LNRALVPPPALAFPFSRAGVALGTGRGWLARLFVSSCQRGGRTCNVGDGRTLLVCVREN